MLGSGHKKGKAAAGQIGDTEVHHPSATQGVTGGMSRPCPSSTTSAPPPLAHGSLARPNAAICSTELCSCSPAQRLESREQGKETKAELSFTRFGFVRVQMGKSWPGTWLFQPQERLLASMSAELRF